MLNSINSMVIMTPNDAIQRWQQAKCFASPLQFNQQFLPVRVMALPTARKFDI
jgi:hypothetical protein